MTENLNEEDVDVHIHTITLQKIIKIENIYILKSGLVIFRPGQLIFLSLARMDQWPQILNR